MILQTLAFNTTQEVVANYLSEHPKDVCIASAGFHDERLVKGGLSDIQHVQHVKEYIELLQHGCRRLVWLHTAACKCEKKHPQSNKLARRWNKLVEEMILGESQFASVIVLDPFEASYENYTEGNDNSAPHHHDNVHMITAYYVGLARALPFVDRAKARHQPFPRIT